MVVVAFVMFAIQELIMKLLPNFPTLKKPNCRQFPELTITALADVLKPDKFTSVHFKRWQVKTMLWLTILKINWVINGKYEQTMSEEDRRKFEEANNLLRGLFLAFLLIVCVVCTCT
jgi:hypothetical protein